MNFAVKTTEAKYNIQSLFKYSVYPINRLLENGGLIVNYPLCHYTCNFCQKQSVVISRKATTDFLNAFYP